MPHRGGNWKEERGNTGETGDDPDGADQGGGDAAGHVVVVPQHGNNKMCPKYQSIVVKW